MNEQQIIDQLLLDEIDDDLDIKLLEVDCLNNSDYFSVKIQ